MLTLYTKPGCAYCRQAKELLDSLHVEYNEIDALRNPELHNEARKKYGWPTVPLIVCNDELLGGYDDIADLHRRGLLLSKIKSIS